MKSEYYSNKLIVECARRMATKINNSRVYTINGKFPKDVQTEIERMKKHCREIEGATER